MTDARVPRLYVDAALESQAKLVLPEDAAHHAARVLRLREGEPIAIFNGLGGEYAARVAKIGKKDVEVEIGEHSSLERESPLAVTLVQGVSSGEKMDFTIQKAVELGVAAIQPILTAKSLVRLNAEREAKKLAHWKRIAIAACEQCGRNRLPEVREAMSVEAYCRAPAPAALRLLLSPGGNSGLKSLQDRIQGTVSLVVGPEAGFSAAEEQLLARAGFVAVRLGRRVLRTETAALAALAVLNALAGDF